MNRDARKAVVIGGVWVFVAGLAVGFFLGRVGRDEPEPVPVASPSPEPTETAPAVLPTTVVVTPTPGQAPAISNAGRILAEGDRPVVAAAQTALCQALVTPGALGECGDVPLAGGRVVWVIEQRSTEAGTAAFTVRLFTFVPDAAGWVEWLRAEDPTAERWRDVNVLTADLTGDGVPELIVGFREVGEEEVLEYDVVSYGQDNLPVVLAHPDPAAKGSVVVAGGRIQEYAAQYPNDEPVCCPASYLRRAIAFEQGFLRVVSSETVRPNAVPPSQL